MERSNRLIKTTIISKLVVAMTLISKTNFCIKKLVVALFIGYAYRFLLISNTSVITIYWQYIAIHLLCERLD